VCVCVVYVLCVCCACAVRVLCVCCACAVCRACVVEQLLRPSSRSNPPCLHPPSPSSLRTLSWTLRAAVQVPFIYSLQARYLVDHDPHLSPLAVGGITLLQLAGYFIFRSANSEKDAFRRDPQAPEVAHLQFLETKRVRVGRVLRREMRRRGGFCICLHVCPCLCPCPCSCSCP